MSVNSTQRPRYPWEPQQGPFDRPSAPSGSGGAGPYNPDGATTTGLPSGSASNPSSIIQLLMGDQRGQGWADLGSALGSFSSGKKSDRFMQGNFMQGHDQMMMGQEANRNILGQRANSDYETQMLDALKAGRGFESDDLRKLQQTAYIKGGGANVSPMSIMLNNQSRQLPSFAGITPQPKTAEEMAGAGKLQESVMGRIGQPTHLPTEFKPSFTYQPSDPNEYAKPGMAENIGSYGGALAGGLGALAKFGDLSKIPGIGGMLSKIPGMGSATGAAGTTGAAGAGGAMSGLMGKALPIAGAVTGGIGLMKDRGLGSNLMNGVTTGASIGSLVPGIGTAVGAGIGGLVGGLRGLGGGPSEQEKAGRQAATQVRQQISSRATPQQIQEAQASGQDPQQALAHIVLRDTLGGEQAASQIMSALFQAEKQGPQAVQQIMSMLSSGR